MAVEVRVIAAGLLLCLGGCFLEPDTVVRGRWGGRLIAMDARASDVRLTFLCGQAVAPPLLIDGSGRFEGTARGTGGGIWVPEELRLAGKIENGMIMTLDVASVYPPHGAQTDTIITNQSYTLLRGATVDFSGWYCA